jgi:hypothetical protein
MICKSKNRRLNIKLIHKSWWFSTMPAAGHSTVRHLEEKKNTRGQRKRPNQLIKKKLQA